MPIWLTIFLALGGSTFCSLLVTLIFNSIVNSAKRKKKEREEFINELKNTDRELKEGMQALLRNELYELYGKCIRKKYATIEERTNFDNMYRRYHNLGQNGVMDDIYHKFMKLPTKEQYDVKGGKRK